jgi:hypothetical protein
VSPGTGNALRLPSTASVKTPWRYLSDVFTAKWKVDDALDVTPLTFGSEQEAFRGRIFAESKCPISKRRKLFIT